MSHGSDTDQNANYRLVDQAQKKLTNLIYAAVNGDGSIRDQEAHAELAEFVNASSVVNR